MVKRTRPQAPSVAQMRKIGHHGATMAPHHWRILKWSSIGTLLALALVVGAVASGIFWLSATYSRSHPLNLLPYLPKVERFFAARGLNIGADSLELYYDEAPVVRVEGLRVMGADGTLAIFIEQAAVKIANGRLLTLAVSPKVIEAKGMTLRLVRGADNVVRIAGLGLTRQHGSVPSSAGVVEWLDDLPADRLWGKLKNVRVQGLTLLLRDELQQAEWVLEEGKLSMDRYAGRGERGSLLATVRRIVGPHLNTPKGVKGTPTPVLVSLERNAEGTESDKLMLEAKFGTLNAAVIADYLPPRVQDIISGQGTLALGSVLTRGNRLGLPWLTLRLKKATLNLPAEAGYTQPLKLPQLEATVSYAPPPTDDLLVKNLSFTGPRGNLFVISGSVASLTTAPVLALSAFSPGGDVQAIFDFFPDANPKMLKTTTWLRQNIQNASYRNLVAHSSLKPKAFPRCADTCGGLAIDAEIEGGSVAFMEGLPAAHIASSSTPARFYWRGQALAVVAPKAKLAEQTGQSVWVSLQNIFAASPTVLTVSTSLSGGLNPLIQTLNGIPEIGGKIPGTYTGTHTALLNLSLPMARQVTPTFASATLTVQGVTKGTEATGLPFIAERTLKAPKVFVTLAPDKTLTVMAPSATLEGGALTFRWQQNLQPHAATARALYAQGNLPAKILQQHFGPAEVSASGGIGVVLRVSESAPNLWPFQFNANAQGAALTLASLGYRKPAGEPLTLATRGTFSPTPTPSGTLTLHGLTLKGYEAGVSGTATLPLADWVKGSFSFPNLRLGGHAFSATLRNQTLTLNGEVMDLRTQNLTTNRKAPNGLNLNTQLARVLFKGGTLRNFTLNAKAQGGIWDMQTLRGTVPNGKFNLRRNGATMDINIENLGALLTTSGVYTGLKDGNLFGQLRGPGRTLTGELKITGFELRNPPIMLKILGLLSLEQLVAGTDTTKFNSGKIPLTLSPAAIELNNAHLTGPSMDIRLNGTYGRTDKILNLQGNLAPAIPFNRLVSKVPLLGTLLTGSQDGVVVADFRLKGPASAPDIHVQPLSVLTPGLLKDLFRGGARTLNME